MHGVSCIVAVGSVSSLKETRASSPLRRERVAILRAFGVRSARASRVRYASPVVRLSPVGGAGSAKVVVGGSVRCSLPGRSESCESVKSRLVVDAGPAGSAGRTASVVVGGAAGEDRRTGPSAAAPMSVVSVCVSAVFAVSLEAPASAYADGTPPACAGSCAVVMGLKDPITPEAPRSTPHSVKKCLGVLLGRYETSDTAYQFDPSRSRN